MAAARSKALSTRILLLLEVHNHRHTRLRTLAQRLDITVQAVSDYLKRLTNEGLVENAAGAWKPTRKGTAFLHETIRDLQDFLHTSMGTLRIIQETYAIADRRLEADEEVGLYMKDGRLSAGPARGAASRGRARTSAQAGQLALVGDLTGILELRPGPVTLLAHPAFPAGPALERARRELQKNVGNGKHRVLVAAHGLTSLAWVWALGLEVDLEFAPLAAAVEAARRGVPVLYFADVADAAACEAALRAPPSAGLEPLKVRRVEP